MNRLLAALALAASATLAASPVLAATTFVQDGAGMFSAGTVSQIEGRLSNFNAQTHKEVVVVTVPSLPAGQDVQQAAQAAFAAQSVNGTLIYIARADHKIYVQADRAASSAGWITSSTATSIAGDIGSQFKAGDMDGGLTTGVNDVLNIYRSHLGSAGATGSSSGSSTASNGGLSFGGIHFQMWWIIVAIVAFFIIRSLTRPRYYGPPGGGVAPGAPGGMPMGYGGGYGYGGGGGGFWSGLLGGLGGAWLGNEMFRGGSGGGSIGGGTGDAGSAPSGDGGGWTSDAGQTGAGGGADWGGGGWGGGDSGGGGGGDFGGGGGGGDSGGGGGGW